MMKHEPKNYDHLAGKLKSLSEKQLEAHLQLYQGYVNKLNEVEALLMETDPSKANYSFGTFSEIKRREAVPFNGAFLHELYFDNLSPEKSEPSADFTNAVKGHFGSWERWVEHLLGTALSGPGWAVVTRNRVDGRIHNYFLTEHHIGLPVHQDILLVVDSWEHAFMMDYANARGDYVKALLDRDVNWRVVSARYDRAKGLTPLVP